MKSTTNYELLNLHPVLAASITDDAVVELANNPHTPDKETVGATISEIRMKLGLGQKVYRALLSQADTAAPVATILENSIGAIIWSYIGAGEYHGTLAGAFPPGKTFLLWNAGSTADGGLNSLAFLRSPTSSTLEITVTSGSPDGQLDNTPIEVRIYP